MATKFFTFHQNNSGGYFNIDIPAGIDENVIVEANDFRHANDLAEDIGLYFNGRWDCSCCGSRWSKMWDDSDGDDVPSIYSEPLIEIPENLDLRRKDTACVHYLSGDIVRMVRP